MSIGTFGMSSVYRQVLHQQIIFYKKKEEELQTCLKCGMTEQIAEQTFVQLSAFSSISLGSNGARLLKNPSSSNPGTYGIKAAGLCEK